jgi:hypothetical protein
MKKTLLATMVAATLAMTGCDDKKDNNSTDLQTAFDLGQRFSQLNADLTSTTAKVSAANAPGDATTTTALKTFIDAEVTALEAKIAAAQTEDLNDNARLERFKKYQEDFEDIQAKLTEYEEMVEKTSMVAAASSAKMDAAFTTIETTLNEDDTAFTLSDIKSVVNKLHNIVKLERVAAEDESAKAVFENVLQAKYEEANKTFDEKFAYAGSDESLVKETPEFVALLNQYLTDINEVDAKATTLAGDLTYTTNAKKLYDALQSLEVDTAYLAMFDKYFSLNDALGTSNTLDAPEDVYDAIVGNKAADATLAPADVKAVIGSAKHKEVSKFVMSTTRGYTATAAAANPGQVTTGNVDIARLPIVVRNIIKYIDDLTTSA